MRHIADNLKGQVYINADNVEAIRKYIRVKNPGCSEEQLSGVFADALHKVIDARIYQFEEKHRKKIKEAVLKKAVKKSEFSIDAAEVFSSCLAMKLHEDSYIQSFTQWMNQSQPIPVSVKEVDKLVTSVEQLDEVYIENNLDAIVDEFDDSWAEDQTFAVLGIEINEEVRGFIDIQVPEEVHEAVPEEVEVADTRRHQLGELFTYIAGLCAETLESLKAAEPSRKLVLQGVLPLAVIAVLVFTGFPGYNRIQGLKHQDQGRYADVAEDQMDRYLSLEARMLDKLGGLTGKRDLVLLDGLHGELRYEPIDQGKLKKWLDRKDSMLTEEPYFTAILETSKKYDIHPVLMFAIVGQEQAFVPRSGAAAKKIANNPFNVYGSWENYNTNIYDSSRLAASTIIESSRNRPAYMNTIRWINRRYAEDPNWWNGVSSIFDQIKKEMTNF